MTNKITFKGEPLTLVGKLLKIGNEIPNFKIIDSELNEIYCNNFNKNKIYIIVSFPSLDTPVCEMQVKEFNKRAKDLADDIEVIGISKDLPFAQSKFVEKNETNAIKLYSDYKCSSFSINCGLLIKELDLTARAVIIIDKNKIIRYIQVVEEVTNQPDYDQPIKILSKIKDENETEHTGDFSKCKACEGEADLLTEQEINSKLNDLDGWELTDKIIKKKFKFKNFVEAKYFVNVVGEIAEEQGHHPDIQINYNKVKLSLTTHAINGLTENDFIMAKIINELGGV